MLLKKNKNFIIKNLNLEELKPLVRMSKLVITFIDENDKRTNEFINKLVKNNLNTQKEVRLPVKADGQIVGIYTPDFVINNSIIIETKAKNFITQEDKKQFWHYLKTTDFKLGFLINFGKPGGVEIVRRVYDTARDKVPRVSA